MDTGEGKGSGGTELRIAETTQHQIGARICSPNFGDNMKERASPAPRRRVWNGGYGTEPNVK